MCALSCDRCNRKNPAKIVKPNVGEHRSSLRRSSPSLTILPEHVGEGNVADKEGTNMLYMQLPLHSKFIELILERMAPDMFQQVGGKLKVCKGVNGEGNVYEFDDT